MTRTNQGWLEETHADAWTIRWDRRPSGAIRGRVGKVCIARIVDTFKGLEIQSLLPGEHGAAKLEHHTTWVGAQHRAGEMLLNFLDRLAEKS
ncbi:hypothetical protein GCM10009555_017070 [Acrocarpospora macrocephala]|uniref:Uncharacterized protein n=1 Tax=Acrocarpospora macrocephala TaxID=150177 RepID=A0A5M3WE79_9ACTN|nr:hypothetical protein [Acrocarpospora macrocephala]GES07367.1 hypothetical protein Amac_009620 [Acrocarpospora macrocephala]